MTVTSRPITGELRDAMDVNRTYTMGGDEVSRTYYVGRDEFVRLCDAIDSIHANLERENTSLKAELDRVMGEQDRDGWVELPKDADGEYICAGDKLDGYGKTIDIVELRYGRCGWVLISSHGSAYVDTYAFSHHQPDTWERIIADAIDASESDELGGGSYEQVMDALVARCRALAGDAS